MFLPINQKLEFERLLKILTLLRDRIKVPGYMTVAQIVVLFRIYKDEPTSNGQLKKVYKTSAAHIARSTHSLEKLGLVYNRVHQYDARRKTITMTDEGRTFIESLLQIRI